MLSAWSSKGLYGTWFFIYEQMSEVKIKVRAVRVRGCVVVLDLHPLKWSVLWRNSNKSQFLRADLEPVIQKEKSQLRLLCLSSCMNEHAYYLQLLKSAPPGFFLRDLHSSCFEGNSQGNILENSEIIDDCYYSVLLNITTDGWRMYCSSSHVWILTSPPIQTLTLRLCVTGRCTLKNKDSNEVAATVSTVTAHKGENSYWLYILGCFCSGKALF